MKQKLTIFVFLSICGCILYAANVRWVLAFTPLYIILSLIVLLKNVHIRHIVYRNALVVGGLFGFITEVIGVQTGYLYGNYSYGSVLGPKLFGVALMLCVMWVFVPLLSYSVTAYSGRYNPLLAGMIAVAYDYILERFAVAYGLWEWQDQKIPILNYATWFIVTAFIVALLQYKKVPKSSLYASRVVLCTHILFFGLLLLI